MSVDDQAVLITEAVSEPYDVLIVGGGILGTATAMILAKSGCRAIVFRLSDKSCPRADTLRNQGWLQSGILYRRKDFNLDDTAYGDTVRRTFAGGYTMLKELGITPSTEQGVVRVPNDGVLRAKLEERRKLFRYKDFYELSRREAEKKLVALPYQDDSTYYNLPDVPFDEANVIETLRGKADGARFVDLTSPVAFSKSLGRTRVHVQGTTIDPPVMLVAAGAGIAKFFTDLEETSNIALRQTPLLVYVGEQAKGVPPIYVDYERGFSSVRHNSNHVSSGAALVIGTRTREDGVTYVLPDQRRISSTTRDLFAGHLCDPFKTLVPAGRFTAGVEVIPQRSSYLDSWIDDRGDVVLASPGRATLGWDTAVRVATLLQDKIDEQHRRHSVNINVLSSSWGDDVHMHFSDRYADLNDIEEDRDEKPEEK